MEYFREVWNTLASVPLLNWALGAEFLVILLLLFILWRHGRWLVKINYQLIESQEALTRRLTNSNETVVARMTELVNKTIERFTDESEEETA